ncbi:hypothetical protein QR680_017337 [Steinernema hermaphroditum]|uniref:Uncharacterized protein n=1 Tax=Steinernema hermaphroditum TaxID=289476 RepID=A0AA39HGC9_9BILA|nr:hypothetical protein QR680_017337 [Steinernema hermaphroditum]
MSANYHPAVDDGGAPSSSTSRKTSSSHPEKQMRGLPRSYIKPDLEHFARHQAGQGPASSAGAFASTSNGESAGRVRRKLPPTPPAYSPEPPPTCLRMIPPVNVNTLDPEQLSTLNERLRCLSCFERADFCDHMGFKRIPPMMRGLVPHSPDTFGSTQHLGESHPSFPFVDPEIQKLMSHHWRTTERIRDEVLPRFELLRQRFGFAPSMTSVRRPTIHFPQFMIDEGRAIEEQEEMERLAMDRPSSAGEAVRNGKLRQRNPAGDLAPNEVITLTPPPEDPAPKPTPKRKPAKKKNKKHK